MLNPVVIPLPLALLAITALVTLAWLAEGFPALKMPELPPMPSWLARLKKPASPGRHHVGAVAEPYRPRPAASRPQIDAEVHTFGNPEPVRTWTPDELDDALDAAEQAATEKILAEMHEAERSWGWGTGEHRIIAEARWDEVPTHELAAR